MSDMVIGIAASIGIAVILGFLAGIAVTGMRQRHAARRQSAERPTWDRRPDSDIWM